MGMIALGIIDLLGGNKVFKSRSEPQFQERLRCWWLFYFSDFLLPVLNLWYYLLWIFVYLFLKYIFYEDTDVYGMGITT